MHRALKTGFMVASSLHSNCSPCSESYCAAIWFFTQPTHDTKSCTSAVIL